MGILYVQGKLSHPLKLSLQHNLRFLVDTGAFFSVAPPRNPLDVKGFTHSRGDCAVRRWPKSALEGRGSPIGGGRSLGNHPRAFRQEANSTAAWGVQP